MMLAKASMDRGAGLYAIVVVSLVAAVGVHLRVEVYGDVAVRIDCHRHGHELIAAEVGRADAACEDEAVAVYLVEDDAEQRAVAVCGCALET